MFNLQINEILAITNKQFAKKVLTKKNHSKFIQYVDLI